MNHPTHFAIDSDFSTFHITSDRLEFLTVPNVFSRCPRIPDSMARLLLQDDPTTGRVILSDGEQMN